MTNPNCMHASAKNYLAGQLFCRSSTSEPYAFHYGGGGCLHPLKYVVHDIPNLSLGDRYPFKEHSTILAHNLLYCQVPRNGSIPFRYFERIFNQRKGGRELWF